MYCELNDAYNTATDLLHSQQNCVYDDIIKDDDSIIEQCKPKNMFTAQGEFKPYSYEDDMQNMNRGGTPIEVLRQKTPIMNLTNSNSIDNKSELEAIHNAETRNIENRQIPSFSINGSKSNRQKSEDKKEIPLSDERIKTIVQNSFHELVNKAKKIKQPRNGKTNIITDTMTKTFASTHFADIRDAMFITFIGILIIFILNIIVRIGRKI